MRVSENFLWIMLLSKRSTAMLRTFNPFFYIDIPILIFRYSRIFFNWQYLKMPFPFLLKNYLSLGILLFFTLIHDKGSGSSRNFSLKALKIYEISLLEFVVPPDNIEIEYSGSFFRLRNWLISH